MRCLQIIWPMSQDILDSVDLPIDPDDPFSQNGDLAGHRYPGIESGHEYSGRSAC